MDEERKIREDSLKARNKKSEKILQKNRRMSDIKHSVYDRLYSNVK